MNTLIVYYSFTSNNERLAQVLRKQIGCDILKIETRKKRTHFSILFDLLFHRVPGIRPLEVSILKYDHVVLLAPIWAGKIATPLRTFLRDQSNNIARYSFISVCGGGDSHQKEKIQRELTDITGQPPEKMVELWISNVLAGEQKGAVKSVSDYRLQLKDIDMFKEELDDFVRNL